jgi:hypothetical protein
LNRDPVARAEADLPQRESSASELFAAMIAAFPA